MTDRLPFVSVIVPVLNGERTIKDCLASLMRSDYPVECREVLVVDNGSRDRTAEIVKEFPVVLLREEQPGAAAARNRGVRESRGEILAFTDADCLVSTGWIRELVREFESAGVGGAEGETVGYCPVTPVERYTARIGRFSHAYRQLSPLAPYVITANAAFHRQVFERVGGFDCRFPQAGGEDIDFSWQFLSRTGLELRYNPRAVVFHRHRSTVGGYLKQQMRNGRGLAILQRKYPARLPWGAAREIRAWGRVLGGGWRTALAAGRHWLRGEPSTQAEDAWFWFVGMVAFRLGFAWQTLAGSR
jgi:glycosyltransferase involved in cell wall biosynthesis